MWSLPMALVDRIMRSGAGVIVSPAGKSQAPAIKDAITDAAQDVLNTETITAELLSSHGTNQTT